MWSLDRRRALEHLAGGGFAWLAGCSGRLRGLDAPDCEPRVGLRLRAVSEDTIVEETDRPPGALHPLARDLVRSAGPSGTATYHSHPLPPRGFSNDPFPISPRGDPQHRYVRLDDAYYRIVVDLVDEGTTTEQVLVGKTNATVSADGRSGDAIEHGDLPRHDRRSFLAFLGGYAVNDREGPPQFERLWRVGYLEDANVRSSLLVPRPAHEYIRYGDWFLRVEWNKTTTDTRYTYELALEHVAESATEFAAAVTETDGVVLREADLSADQREMLDEAAGGTAWVCTGDSSNPDDDIVWVDRDDSDDAHDPSDLVDLMDAIGDARYVNHDGTWYDVSVTRWA